MTLIYKTWVMVTGSLFLMIPAFGQSSADSLRSLSGGADTTEAGLDTMQLTLLHRAMTFAQIERVVRGVALRPDYLPLIPCVLPVDLPLTRFRVTSSFGPRRHPIYRQWRFHSGVDVKAPQGLSVKATAAGIVRQVGYDPELGAYVRLYHAFGFETVYGHLNGYCVRTGQSVRCGDLIGRVGQTGAATGPHLHYTIKKNGSIVDPFLFCFLLRRQLTNGLIAGIGDTLTTPPPVRQPH